MERKQTGEMQMGKGNWHRCTRWEPRVKLTIRANGETFRGQYWAGAGFCSSMPDGENRTWAEQKAAELFDDRSLSSIEDAENLRGVALAGHGFCLTALNS